MRLEGPGQIPSARSQVPANRDSADSEQRSDRIHRHCLELIHHDDGATSWGQPVQGLPDRGFCNQGRFRVLPRLRGRGIIPRPVVAVANPTFPPLVTTDIDEDTDQPGFLFTRAA